MQLNWTGTRLNYHDRCIFSSTLECPVTWSPKRVGTGIGEGENHQALNCDALIQWQCSNLPALTTTATITNVLT